MPPTVLDDLVHPDPARRIAGLAALRYRDLKHPAVLEAALRACRDPAVPADASASGQVADPFAAFFGAAPTATSGPSVALAAAERLERTGLPPDDATFEILARVLGEGGTEGELPRLTARALGQTRWVSLEAALMALVPALDEHDQPLFEAIVALPSDATPVLARLAASPLRPRLLQELLNHPPSRAAAVAEVERAARDRLPEAADLMTLLAVLAAWGEAAAGRIAVAAMAREPWAAAFGAIVDPGAAAPLSSWLTSGAPAPAGLFDRVSEVLRQRGIPEGFPLADWLRAAGDDLGLCSTWIVGGADRTGIDAPGVPEVLEGWVSDLARGRPTARGWAAAAALARAQRHGSVVEALGRAVTTAELPWDEVLLTALAQACPPIPGLGAAIARQAPLDDPGPGVPALLALADGGHHALVARAVDAAEGAAREVVPVGRGVVRDGPVGIDLEALAPLVEVLDDPGLTERFEAVSPVIRAG